MLTGLGAKTTVNYKIFLHISALSAAVAGWCVWYLWHHGGWSRLGRLVWSGCLWEGLLGLVELSRRSPSSGHVFPQQPVHLCDVGRAWARARGHFRRPRQDTAAEVASKASPAPSDGAVDRWFACLRSQSQDFCRRTAYPGEPLLASY